VVTMRACDQQILKTLSLADEMINMAEEGDQVREDDSCGILYATLRDAGYRIKAMALREKENHMKKGLWKP